MSDAAWRAGFVVGAILALLGCVVFLIAHEDMKRYEISCGSGFESPVTDYAEVKYGHVMWREGGVIRSRRMEEGEICDIEEAGR